ncbi:hypothetical protein [Leucobacter sp. wl10]|uniref:hypothetical protein n=1 Tax=Leucobacter sp. wl10 TaxID=2304677 RepID=UPI000E5B9917|nr:hypothetical protein [Leucobacter sp. wl10]RGE17105.1 hypothetical protein D1J51_16210 [Leucobacter sp. wl10]
MGTKPRGRAKRILGFIVFLAVLALVVFAMTHRQEIRDRFSAVGFETSPQIERVLKDLRLTASGERIFLATRPTLDGSSHFNEQCAGVERSEQEHVLGCYAGDRIHLFDVTDERITGIVGVTAAHELLHAAYNRLGEGERDDLGGKLRREFDRLSADDPELRERMSVYRKLSDSAFASELHSVLGTEVKRLPRWLDDWYAQWFRDRGSLVASFDEFHTVFAELQRQADSLRSEMATLRDDVERRKADYDRAVETFNADAADFSGRNERSEFAEAPDEFDRIKSELEGRRTELERTRQGLQTDIDRYNAMREQLVALSETSSKLDQQLNSDLAPLTTRPDE